MAGKNIHVHIDGLDDLIKKMKRLADDDLRREVANWLDACGMEFLEEVQNQIVAMQVVDTRRLLNSFDKGNGENIWVVKDGGFALEIGTNVEYARFVNDGHWTNKQGQSVRFIPGHFKGNGSFEYRPGADTGMVLKQQWIPGRPYWDKALHIFKAMFEASFAEKFQEWARRVSRGS